MHQTIVFSAALVFFVGMCHGDSHVHMFDTGVTYAKAMDSQLMLSNMMNVEDDPNMVHFTLHMIKEVKEDNTMPGEDNHALMSDLMFTLEDMDNVTQDGFIVRRVSAMNNSVSTSYGGELKINYDIAYDAGTYILAADQYNFSLSAGDVVVMMQLSGWTFDATGSHMIFDLTVKGNTPEPVQDGDYMAPFHHFKLGNGAMMKLPRLALKGDPMMAVTLDAEDITQNMTHFHIRLPKDNQMAYAFILSVPESAAAHVVASALALAAMLILQKFFI